jgi:hypothetical protein
LFHISLKTEINVPVLWEKFLFCLKSLNQSPHAQDISIQLWQATIGFPPLKIQLYQHSQYVSTSEFAA